MRLALSQVRFLKGFTKGVKEGPGESRAFFMHMLSILAATAYQVAVSERIIDTRDRGPVFVVS
jgi:hypothetical protein